MKEPKITIKGSGMKMRVACNFTDEALKVKMITSLVSDTWNSDEYREQVKVQAVRMARHIKVNRSTRFALKVKRVLQAVGTFFLRFKIAFTLPKEDIRRHQYGKMCNT